MGYLIKNRQIASDSWQLLELPAGGPPQVIPPDGDLILPLALWLAERQALIARSGRLGISLNGDDDPALIAEDLKNFGLIAVRFPHFTDGRGYSLGRLLRERYGWRGELRAIGDIARDQLFYLARVGFDAFVLREGEDAAAALAALGDFSEAYQAAADQPQPLFRRRSTAVQGGIGDR